MKRASLLRKMHQCEGDLNYDASVVPYYTQFCS